MRRVAAEAAPGAGSLRPAATARAPSTSRPLVARTGDRSTAQHCGSGWRRSRGRWPRRGGSRRQLEALAPGAAAALLERAERALRATKSICSVPAPCCSGPASAGTSTSRVARAGRRATSATFPILHAQRPSDIKVPWELSRLQWLIPAGQAYLLTGDERFAAAAREVLRTVARGQSRRAERQLGASPWSRRMRIFSWTWLFRVFARQRAWEDVRLPRRAFSAASTQHGAVRGAQPRARRRQRQSLHRRLRRAGCRGRVLRRRGGASAGCVGACGPRARDRRADLGGRRRFRGLRGLPPPGERAVPARGAACRAPRGR